MLRAASKNRFSKSTNSFLCASTGSKVPAVRYHTYSASFMHSGALLPRFRVSEYSFRKIEPFCAAKTAGLLKIRHVPTKIFSVQFLLWISSKCSHIIFKRDRASYLGDMPDSVCMGGFATNM